MESKTEIVLMGNRFSIKSNLSDPQVSIIVKKVESMLKSTQQKSKSMSLQSAALVTCLSLACELAEKQIEIDNFKNESVLRLTQLKDLLNEGKLQREEDTTASFEGKFS